MRFSSSLFSWIDECAQGKLWWPRVPLLLWMLWVWAHHVIDHEYQSLAKGLNLGIHELGHIMFIPLGQFISVAGGSMNQCLIPLIGVIMFLRQRDPFAVFFAFGWLGTNLFDVAAYIDDARSMDLPLVSPFSGGEEIIHDWNWLLGHMHLLEYDHAIARVLWLFANASFALCVAGGTWTLWRMMNFRPQ
jgi:hypothetical protein